MHVRKIVSLLQSREVESEFSNFWVGLGTTTSEDAVLWVWEKEQRTMEEYVAVTTTAKALVESS